MVPIVRSAWRMAGLNEGKQRPADVVTYKGKKGPHLCDHGTALTRKPIAEAQRERYRAIHACIAMIRFERKVRTIVMKSVTPQDARNPAHTRGDEVGSIHIEGSKQEAVVFIFD